jgi:GTP-sensing pleiotropic transcriptional regulator CodY
MIQKTDISRPVWTSLLQKMEKYGVAIVKSQGVKGTYVEFKEEMLEDGT